jgi:hypothetical protein
MRREKTKMIKLEVKKGKSQPVVDQSQERTDHQK